MFCTEISDSFFKPVEVDGKYCPTGVGYKLLITELIGPGDPRNV